MKMYNYCTLCVRWCQCWNWSNQSPCFSSTFSLLHPRIIHPSKKYNTVSADSVTCDEWTRAINKKLWEEPIAYFPCHSIAVNCCWPRQHSRSWFRAQSGLTTKFLFAPRPFMCLEMGLPLGRQEVLVLLSRPTFLSLQRVGLGTGHIENTASNSFYIVACVYVAAGTCLLRRYVATSVSTIQAFRRHVTLLPP
jgi:hypothetical protein